MWLYLHIYIFFFFQPHHLVCVVFNNKKATVAAWRNTIAAAIVAYTQSISTYKILKIYNASDAQHTYPFLPQCGSISFIGCCCDSTFFFLFRPTHPIHRANARHPQHNTLIHFHKSICRLYGWNIGWHCGWCIIAAGHRVISIVSKLALWTRIG